ncbi:hypothetical protein DTO280E4_2891 [Paecilomyces variotii]|nr:hypothetical protein DTO280E4_2891 [Paecilomyces variotii]
MGPKSLLPKIVRCRGDAVSSPRKPIEVITSRADLTVNETLLLRIFRAYSYFLKVFFKTVFSNLFLIVALSELFVSHLNPLQHLQSSRLVCAALPIRGLSEGSGIVGIRSNQSSAVSRLTGRVST